MQELHGDFGVASVIKGLNCIYANPDTGLCVVQARHGPHRLVASCLPFLTRIQNERVVPRLIYTGATIRCCYLRMEKFQRAELERLLAEVKTRQRVEDSSELGAAREELERVLLPLKQMQHRD